MVGFGLQQVMVIIWVKNNGVLNQDMGGRERKKGRYLREILKVKLIEIVKGLDMRVRGRKELKFIVGYLV